MPTPSQVTCEDWSIGTVILTTLSSSPQYPNLVAFFIWEEALLCFSAGGLRHEVRFIDAAVAMATVAVPVSSTGATLFFEGVMEQADCMRGIDSHIYLR
jgi:hypothetical protein